mmetsp:Transcript_97229/g.178192  ORF Transcript_97229/g.178192 Transcript_97229/m.178192 type:complete len:95 (-) Transcript_97229:49-333(-)
MTEKGDHSETSAALKTAHIEVDAEHDSAGKQQWENLAMNQPSNNCYCPSSPASGTPLGLDDPSSTGEARIACSRLCERQPSLLSRTASVRNFQS